MIILKKPGPLITVDAVVVMVGRANVKLLITKQDFWDNCYRNGVSFRSYGEFVSGDKPTIKVLQNNICPKFPDYNLSIRDTTRIRIWREDFDSLLAKNKLPQFNTVRIGNDHTEGVRLGRPSPFAHVADNDLAVGLLIEKLATSSIWNETAVFIVEDDAQNGADHIDAHRSTAYLAGGFVKRGFCRSYAIYHRLNVTNNGVNLGVASYDSI